MGSCSKCHHCTNLRSFGLSRRRSRPRKMLRRPSHCWTSTWTPAPSWWESESAWLTSPWRAPCCGCTSRFDVCRRPLKQNVIFFPTQVSVCRCRQLVPVVTCRSWSLLSASRTPTWLAGLSRVSTSPSSRQSLERWSSARRWVSLMVSLQEQSVF